MKVYIPNTDLYLHVYHLDHRPTFNGFGSLTRLFLRCVNISTKTLVRLLSKSPLLKDLSLLIDEGNIIGDDRSTITELFKYSPLIENLYICFRLIEIFCDTSFETSERDSVTLKDYSDIWLEHLNEFQIVDISKLKHEVEFVKLILTKSPVLRKVSIFVYPEVTKDEEMLVSRNLLHSPRASPLLEIIVGHLPEL